MTQRLLLSRLSMYHFFKGCFWKMSIEQINSLTAGKLFMIYLNRSSGSSYFGGMLHNVQVNWSLYTLLASIYSTNFIKVSQIWYKIQINNSKQIMAQWDIFKSRWGTLGQFTWYESFIFSVGHIGTPCPNVPHSVFFTKKLPPPKNIWSSLWTNNVHYRT